jgi:UDP:flavonoid glycosyltransferase YjiC (YdhE family)
MRVTILAFGTRGDIQPFVALGGALQATGHAVRIVTHASFYDFVTRYGLDCTTIDIDFRKAWQSQEKAGVNLFAVYRMVRDDTMQALLTMWEASQDAEALIFNYMGRIPGKHIAEKLGVPTFLGPIHPHQMDFFYRARMFNDVGEPVFNLKEVIQDNLVELIYMSLFNRWRKNTLGLPTAPLLGNDRWFQKQQIPVLCSWSPSVYPKRPEWPDWFDVTGYWFLPYAQDWQPPQELVDFLAAGPPPVYIGFSSVTHLEREDMTTLIVQALAQSGQRGIITSGWSALGQESNLPDTIYATQAIPHDWLFSQVSVAVHHGGVGTTGAALRAGIPSVIIPFVVDEPFWAWQVNQLGAGTPGIPPKQLTAERLAAALDTAANDKTLRKRAAQLGIQIQSEQGVERAVDIFHKHIGSL